MATRPEDRYVSCRALAEDVERWMADEPVSAWREPVLRRVARWGRRHRPLVAGAAMLLVSAVAALSVGAVLINRERSKAEANFRQARAAVDEYFTTVSESKRGGEGSLSVAEAGQAGQARKLKLKVTIAGGREAHLLARELGAAGVGVLLTQPRPFPKEWEARRM